MKIPFITIIFLGLLSSSAQASTQFLCRSGANKVKFTLDQNKILNFNSNGEPESGVPEAKSTDAQGTTYSFYFYDYADTNYWLDIKVSKGNIVSAAEFSSGNDADNYEAKPTQARVQCIELLNQQIKK